MRTFEQAVAEAVRLQAEAGAPLQELECSAPDDRTVIAYIRFVGAQWETIGFAMPHPYDRALCEQAFIAALAFHSGGATVH